MDRKRIIFSVPRWSIIHIGLAIFTTKGGVRSLGIKEEEEEKSDFFPGPNVDLRDIVSLSLHLDLDLVFFFESKDKEGAKRGNREGGREGAIHFENRTRRNRFLIAAHYERKISTICLG